LEHSDLFSSSLGESSDVVHKELFQFQDKGGGSLCLRPEGTAAVSRAVLTNHLYKKLPLKFYYSGPMFRYENPQKGRLRQFDQFGMEYFGSNNYLVDFECLSIAWDFIKQLNLDSSAVLNINSLGSAKERAKFKSDLVEYLLTKQHLLSEDSKNRLERGSVLRILDSKASQDIQLLSEADCPVLFDYLESSTHQRFLQLQRLLCQFDIPFKVNHKLVRGLDYYKDTVFEITFNSKALGLSQNTIVAGGRYDGLLERKLAFKKLQQNQKEIGCFGWAAGINRIAYLLDSCSLKKVGLFAHLFDPAPLLVAGDLDADTIIKVCSDIRKAEIECTYAMELFGDNSAPSLSSQLKKLTSLNESSSFAILLKEGRYILKRLDTGSQESFDDLSLAVNMVKNSE
jgi:histidyl-tRNA synthetase